MGVTTAIGFDQAAKVDAPEDAEHVPDQRGEMPDWMADKQQRLARIRAARAALEAEAKAAVAAKDAARPEPVSSRDGFIQGYNGQAAVDSKQQIIVAHRLTQNASDQDGLLSLLDDTAVNAGRLPDEVSADNGFCSEANLAGLVECGVRSYVDRTRQTSCCW